jgi:hypothetical protein
MISAIGITSVEKVSKTPSMLQLHMRASLFVFCVAFLPGFPFEFVLWQECGMISQVSGPPYTVKVRSSIFNCCTVSFAHTNDRVIAFLLLLRHTRCATQNLFFIIPKCISLIGFTVGTLEPKYDEEFYKVVPAQVKSGEIKYTEERNKGLQATGQALYNVLTGANTAKSVIVVAEQ